MNAMQVMTNYADQLASIAEAMTAAKAVKDGNAETASAAASTLTNRVKEYATLTATDGVPVEDARKGFQLALTGLEAPAGSIKASGNHFAGFRKLIDDGKDIAPLSTKDAQEAVQSEEVTAIKAAKKALNTYAKDHKWKAADWMAMLEREGIVIGGAETDESEVEAEARAAA